MNFLSVIFTSLFAGIAGYLLSTQMLGLTEQAITKFWLRPYKRVGGRGFLWRVKMTVILCQYSRSYVLLASLPSVAVWTLVFAGPRDALLIAISHFLGFWVVPVLIGPRFTLETLPRFSLLLSITAMKRLVQFVPANSARPTLQWAASQSHWLSNLAAVNGYMEITEGWAYQALESMSKGTYLEVAEAAKEAAGLVYSAVYGSGPRSLEKMAEYVAHYEEVEQALSKQVGRKLEKKQILAEAGAEIDDLVYSQLKLKEAHPNLYCLSCLAWAEMVFFREWEWVRCKRCHDVLGLQRGIERVVGEIGGNHDHQVVNGVLLVNLWDAATRQAKLAEVDALKIIGGKDIDYDWAVNAVLQKLQNQNPDHETRIPLRIEGNVPLSQNSRHLLRGLDPKAGL